MDGPPGRDRGAEDPLTPRERQIVGLIANGLTTKDIAEALGASPLTIRKHRSNILRKLNLGSAAALVAYAARTRNSLAPAEAPTPRGLTARELEIVELLRAGMTNKEVGRCLKISDTTVRKHRERIYNKLGIRQLSGLIAGADRAKR